MIDIKPILIFLSGLFVASVVAAYIEYDRLLMNAYSQGQVDCMSRLTPEVVTRMTTPPEKKK